MLSSPGALQNSEETYWASAWCLMNSGPLDSPLGCRDQPSRSGWFPAHTLGGPGLTPSVKCFGLAYFLTTVLFLAFFISFYFMCLREIFY